jgi:F420-non-reducing hydrogenase iron-sulfur subunit
MNPEEPRIVCFVCNWAFSEEELAVDKTRRVASVNVVHVTCIGGIDPIVIVETFMKGVDGILLVGCAPPDCHFVEGNVYAEHTVDMLKKLLILAHLEPERLQLRWFSPLDEVGFSEIIEDFVKQLQRLGASKLRSEKRGENVFESLSAAKSAVASFRLRALAGIERELTEGVNAYGERTSLEEFNALLDRTIKTEFIRHKILLLAKEKPFSVKELSKTLHMKSAVVLHHVLSLRREGMIDLDSIEGRTPLYKTVEFR